MIVRKKEITKFQPAIEIFRNDHTGIALNSDMFSNGHTRWFGFRGMKIQCPYRILALAIAG